MKEVKKVNLICHYCKRSFQRNLSSVIVGWRTFCGRVCFDADRPVLHSREEVLQFLVEHALSHGGQSPTYREIGERVGISSLSVVRYVLDDLAEEGLIVLPHKKKSRAIEVVGMRLVWEDPRELGIDD